MDLPSVMCTCMLRCSLPKLATCDVGWVHPNQIRAGSLPGQAFHQSKRTGQLLSPAIIAWQRLARWLLSCPVCSRGGAGSCSLALGL